MLQIMLRLAALQHKACATVCAPLLAKRSSALLTASSDMPLHQRLLARQKPRCRCLHSKEGV